mgnify:CR=1 FL=1
MQGLVVCPVPGVGVGAFQRFLTTADREVNGSAFMCLSFYRWLGLLSYDESKD